MIGIRLFYRDTSGGLILASRHPKWSLTWAWVLRFSKGGKSVYLFRTYKYKSGIYGRISVFGLSLERQPTMDMKGVSTQEWSCSHS